ncbi:MAG: exosortase-associated EpsI family protein [Kiritimatiellia bacterium]
MRTRVTAIVATLLVVAAMVYQAKTVEPVLAAAPSVVLPELAGFVSEEVPVSEAELTTLPNDTAFVKRAYTGDDGWFQVTAVIGGRSKRSVHRPELCLPSQGFQMTAPRNLRVDGVDWHLVTLARRDAPSMGFAYTFFNQAGFRTSSHLRRIFRDVWDRSVLGRIDRWVMVTVHASTDDERALSAFLARLGEVVR